MKAHNIDKPVFSLKLSNSMKSKLSIHYNIATLFGLGYVPFAPGTIGTLVALPFCLFLHRFPVAYILTFLVLFVLGVISSDIVEKNTGTEDPTQVIIDEAACIFVAFFMVPLSLPIIIIGFIAFRLLDIFKVPPMKSAAKVGGGWGIMLDDLIAGLYTNLILQIIVLFF